MDVGEFLKRYAAGDREFDHVSLRQAKLSGADLRDAWFFRADLSAADLSSTNLIETNFADANLSGANLSDANLREASLEFTEMSNTCLRGAKVRTASMVGANLSNADLSGADLNESYLSEANLSGADLSGASLSGANLSGANLPNANLNGADLRRADLRRANLSRVNLSGANLSGASLSGADLRRANLSGGNLSGADLSGASLFEAVLTNTLLSKAKLDGTILAYQKIFEELQQENQNLTKKIEFFEAQIENLIEEQVQRRLITNQGISSKKSETWNRLRFRSKAELEIAKVLDEMGVMYFPTASGRVMSEDKMVTREVDFLVCSRGKWGILECDGEIWHLVNSIKKGKLPSAASDHKRDNDFNRHGQWFIKRFTAEDCEKIPHKVARQFLDMLHKFHEDQRYLAMGDSAIEITNGSLLYDMDEDQQWSLGATQCDHW